MTVLPAPDCDEMDANTLHWLFCSTVGAPSVVSGPGVPVENLTTIFEPYYTTKPDGTGIGLWIAQQIVTAHRGAIEAAPARGGGALFTIRLPLGETGETHG